MRGVARLRVLLATVLLGAVAMTVSLAQVRPIDVPVRPHPIVLPHASPSSTPLLAPTLAPKATPTPAGLRRILPPLRLATPAPLSALLQAPALPSALGPKIPLSMLPKLPAQNSRNTYNGGRRPMSDDMNSMMFFEGNSLGNCATTVGDIFNNGCSVDFFFSCCNFQQPQQSGKLQSVEPQLHLNPTTDQFQDYYIDATTTTAQTAGCKYKPSTGKYTSTSGSCTNGNSYLATQQTDPQSGTRLHCTANGWAAAACPYGPGENVTLNNTGTVVLATLDTTTNMWVNEVYVSVVNPGATNGGLLTFSDSMRRNPIRSSSSRRLERTPRTSLSTMRAIKTSTSFTWKTLREIRSAKASFRAWVRAQRIAANVIPIVPPAFKRSATARCTCSGRSEQARYGRR